MSGNTMHHLSRRERQIMDILIEGGELSAQAIQTRLPNPPSYSAVRALLARLVDKGVVNYRQHGAKYIYYCAIEQANVQASAIQRLVKTFFRGSKLAAVSALLDTEADALSEQELRSLERRIQNMRRTGSETNRKRGA